MQNMVRTTIRIRKDLISQSRMIALKRSSSLQSVINDTLAAGFGHVTDFNIVNQSMKKIDDFRKSLTSKNVKLGKLLKISKDEQR